MNSRKLHIALDKLESHLEHREHFNFDVSKSNVAWHIDHSLKVINKVIAALQASKPEHYKNNFSLLGRVFFTLGFFPRGRARAPKQVLPPEQITTEDVISQLKLAKTNMATIENLDRNAYFDHPIFGHINTKRVHKFLWLHTNHHLKIIDDIVNKS